MRGVKGRGSRDKGLARCARLPSRGDGAMPSIRTAFTLVEVLLALALSGVLIASVVASMELYRRLSETGHRDVERARIARALFDRISDDLRSVTFRPAEEEESSSSSEDEEVVGAAEEETTEVEETPAIDTVDTESAYEGGVGIAGDMFAIVIQSDLVARTEATATYTLPELLQIGGRTSDQRSVTYFVAQPGQAGLVGAVTSRLTALSTRPVDQNEPLGLVRIEGDRMTMALADETGDYERLAADAVLIAPEVKTMTLRYFDGTQWQVAWDTELYQTLPRAVEVTLGIAVDPLQPRQRQPGEIGNPEQPTVVEHRFVIHLPQADPTPLEDMQ